MRKKVFILVLIFIIIALLYLIYSLFLNKPKAGFIAGQSNTITQLPEPGNATLVIFDFANCSKGSDIVSFGMGSTSFAFEGNKQNMCVFYYGTEIENPNWDGTLPFKCTVPVDLGKKTYSVGNFGISMNELDAYCVKL